MYIYYHVVDNFHGIQIFVDFMSLFIHKKLYTYIDYHKQGNIHWAKLSQFSWLLKVLWKFSREYLSYS